MNRRELAKGIAAGLAAGSVPGISLPQPQSHSHAESGKNANAPLEWTLTYPGIWRAHLAVPEAHTPVSMRQIAPRAQALHSLPAVDAPPLQGARGGLSERGCRLSFPLQPDELIYGFGLQLLSFQQRGKKRIIRVNADPKGDAGDSHAPAPFYVTTRGYGILVDTLRHAQFYCGEAHPAPRKPAEPQAAAVNTPEETREREGKTVAEVLVEVPRAHGVDVYLFAGPTMLNAVQRYVLFSGGGALPPEWGLGFWYRAEMHLGQKEVLELAGEFRKSKIPCDVIGLEPGWQTHAYSCSFVWERTRFPDPKAFLKDAAAADFHVNLWEHAFTHPTSPIFESLVPHAGDFAVWGGLVPDFAGEPAQEIFGNYHGKELIDAGVSGFKLDECDNSDYTGGWSFPDMSRFPSGLDGEQMHAAFGLRYQYSLLEQFAQRRQPTYSLVRSSGALSAPYPFVLYSDLYDHRQFVRGVANSGFSGLLWCPEVRDAASQEDLIRRLQTVVFSPLAMVNAWYIKNPPWKQLNRELNNRGVLMDDWQAVEAQCREIIAWRMRLVPYLLSAFHRYAHDGTPPFRAPVLDDPANASLRTVDDEYMIGDRMLVAPLFAGEPGRTVTLPAGSWHDFWTGELVQGGPKLQVPASARNIPVFVKAGSVIPLAQVGDSSAGVESRKLSVLVFGNGSLPWRMRPGTEPQIEISWDPQAGHGSVKQSKRLQSGDRPYQVVAWRPMTG